MPAPNGGHCPHCKTKYGLYYFETKNGKEYYKCNKCHEVVTK